MTRALGLAAMATLAVWPNWSLGWTAQNLLEVQQLNSEVIEVIGGAGSGPAQYWCGAGDYFRRVKGIGGAQRIYIWRGVGPSETQAGRAAVQFALTAPDGADTSTSYTLSMKRAGDNMSAGLAQQYCWGQRIIGP